MPLLDGLFFDLLDGAEDSWFERYFVESEMLEVVKARNSDQVLGLDGYFMAFFQACRVILKEGIMKVFRDFHATCKW